MMEGWPRGIPLSSLPGYKRQPRQGIRSCSELTLLDMASGVLWINKSLTKLICSLSSPTNLASSREPRRWRRSRSEASKAVGTSSCSSVLLERRTANETNTDEQELVPTVGLLISPAHLTTPQSATQTPLLHRPRAAGHNDR